MNIFLGHDKKTGQKIHVPKKSFDTHWHLMGGTGKGKTTAVHTMLHGLLVDPTANDCWFILDRMGNLSYELLLWLVSDFCPPFVRDRVVYIEPANEAVVMGFNPLLFQTPAQGYYKVSRSTDTILRGWENTDIQTMPRLARWMFNAFWAAAQLGLTISDCVHLLNPGSPFHASLLYCLPPLLKAEWDEILRAHGSEATRILESTRNRLKPYFESDILRRMFGSKRNHLDVFRMMKEGRIVIVNLSSKGRLSGQEADAIGGLIINEILAIARSLPFGERYPTYLLLDEFQRFVGRDLEEALPEVRQLQIRLILAHQSFSQLQRGDHDLTSLIFQAQSRMIFGVQGEDADLLAHELGSITFDPKKIKDELYSRRQMQKGHHIVELTGWSDSESQADNWQKAYGTNWADQKRETRDVYDYSNATISRGDSTGRNEQEGKGGSLTRGRTTSTHQQLVANMEEFLELTMRSYYSFDELVNLWARDIRNRKVGEAFLRLSDDANIYDVKVKRSVPGHLQWDMNTLRREYPQALDDVEKFIEENFRSDFFTSPQMIDQETKKRLEAIASPAINVNQVPALESSAVLDDPLS